MMLNKVRKLICALLCVATLAGCTNKEKPKQYVAELSNPYLSTLPSSFNKRLDVSYQFQNTFSKEGDFSTIDFLHLEVYKDDVMIGYKIVTAKDTSYYLEDGDYDMIIGRTDIPLDIEIKSDGVLVTTDVDDEYFFPSEILSMDDDVAKEKYATTLKQIKEEKEKQYLVELKNEIKWYEKSLAEKKKHLEELEKELKS